MDNNILGLKRKETLYNVQFESNNALFCRKCILPSNIEMIFVKKYLARSLILVEKSIKVLGTKDVYVIDTKINEHEEIQNNNIEKYWLDMFEYEVEIEQGNDIMCFSVVIGIDSEKEYIEKVFRQYYPDGIIIVDYIQHAWLKRCTETTGDRTRKDI